MKIRECLETAAFLLNFEEAAAAIRESREDQNAEAEALAGCLERCAALVISEIATDHFPVTRVEEVFTESDKLPYESLSARPADILGIKKDGQRVGYKLYPGFIKTGASGRLNVEYSMLPEMPERDGELELWPDKVNARNLAYGIVCEYCLINGMTDDAVMWDKRFRDAMHNAGIQKGERRVRARRWY